MSLKTLLVCLTTPENTPGLMAAATALARAHGSHVIGLHTVQALLIYPGLAMHVPAPAFQSFNDAQAEDSAAIKAAFDAAADDDHFPSEWRLFEADDLSAAERMLENARGADLIIMAQPDRDTDRPDQLGVQERLIRDAGRPVLMVPRGFEGGPIGTRAVIGWSATREATRAAHDALDLLQPEAEANIVIVDPDPEGDALTAATAAELARAYDRHGVSTTVVHRGLNAQRRISDALLEAAEAREADLIVTGAFGHSRMYDFVLGAVTLDLLENAPIPVLFSK